MDPHHFEQEFKLTAPAGDPGRQVLAAVWETELVKAAMQPGSFKPARPFHGKYYDTANFALINRRWSLRARKEGARFRAALKIGSRIENGFLQNEEYEADISDWMKTPEDLPGCELKTRLLEAIPVDARLHVRVEVKMQRQLAVLQINGAEVELCTDSGTIHANNGKFVELNEVEVELKSGTPEQISGWVAELQAGFQLKPSLTSKHRIGQNLYA